MTDNERIINKLSNRSLMKNKTRNLVAIIAIALTTIMFTALFTVGQGIIQLGEEQTMRQVGTRAHAGLKGVTYEEYKKITDQPLVVQSDYGRIIALAENEELAKRNVQIEWTTKEHMKSNFQHIDKGSLPVKEDDIVLDDIVLNMLNVPKKLGSEVRMNFTYLGQKYHKTFRLCGWYEGDKVAKASSAFISQKCIDEMNQGLTELEIRKYCEEQNENRMGLIYADLYFSNTFNIESNVKEAIRNAGYRSGNDKDEISYGVNWAYATTNMDSADPFTTMILVLTIIVIIISGYLIIYNIFQISILKDIRFYGLLKTIGTTKKQIASLIRRQAMILSCIGIPIGLFFGYMIGLKIIPRFLRIVELRTNGFEMKANPYIFIVATIFSLITVIISCYKPGKIAGKVSPIEAMKYVNVSPNLKRGKMHKKINIFSMAVANLRRDRKKTVVVVLSLSLSIVVLVEIVTFVKSFSMNKYLKEQLVQDFTISSTQLKNHHGSQPDLSIDPDYVDYVKSLDGIKQFDEMYCSSYGYHKLSNQALQKYQTMYEQGKLRVEDYNKQTIEHILKGEDSVSEDRYAYSDSVIGSLKVLDGTIDLKKFDTGKYVILGPVYESDESYYKPGDHITLQYKTEQSKFCYDHNEQGNDSWNSHYDHVNEVEYEVMAIVDFPGNLSTGWYGVNALTTILPVDELKRQDIDAQLFNIGLWVNDDDIDHIDEALKSYTTNVNPKMDYNSRKTLANEFKGFSSGMLIVGGAIAVVVAMIGILNFINTILTNVLSRQNEIAMLQSIGLTDKQLKRMLLYEGISYVGLTSIVSIIVGTVISLLFVRALGNIVEYFEYHFIYTPYLYTLPIMLVISALIPFIAYHNTKRISIVERLRLNEN